MQPPQQEPPSKKKVHTKNIWTSELTAALDRTKTSDRNAIYIVTETAKSLGHDPEALNISRPNLKGLTS